ncbi:PDZ domain-containing protein [Candidatus Saccharibacteria bacterium]|nr:PDZ domain-containing protein [Candidatus Saccharibacteria bacterium]
MRRPENADVRYKEILMNYRYILACVLLICAGCASNPFSRYYHDYTGGAGVRNSDKYIITTNAPIIRDGTDLFRDADEMYRDGYFLIGESYFWAVSVNRSMIMSHARGTGAEIVLLYSKYLNTVSGSIPVTLPNNTVSYSQGSGFAYGSGGHAHGYGNAQTITYGTRTVNMPYQSDRYQFNATYWAKAKPTILGVQAINLSEAQRRDLQSNKGVCIKLVVRGGPAFISDVLEGDIIKKINDEEIMDIDHFSRILKRHKGKGVTFSIIRNDEVVNKNVQLN